MATILMPYRHRRSVIHIKSTSEWMMPMSTIVDFRRGLTESQRQRIVHVDTVPSELLYSARMAFNHYSQNVNSEVTASEVMPDACTVYEHKDFDGQMQPPSPP